MHVSMNKLARLRGLEALLELCSLSMEFCGSYMLLNLEPESLASP